MCGSGNRELSGKDGGIQYSLSVINYYSRFEFESGKTYGITVSENEFNKEYLQILFPDKSIKGQPAGRFVYCDAFYDNDGNLLWLFPSPAR